MNRLIITTLCLGLTSITSAFAIETGCTSPTAPQLPASITSETQMNTLEAATITYLTEASAYHQCLIDYASANDATLTQADRTELRTLYDAMSAASKAYSEEWNQKLTSFMTQ